MSRDVSVNVYVDVDVDDVIDNLSEQEKRELYEQLGEELDEDSNITHDDDFDVAQYLGGISNWNLKKILCLLLNVPSYHDEKTLRERLEPIITAE